MINKKNWKQKLITWNSYGKAKENLPNWFDKEIETNNTTNDDNTYNETIEKTSANKIEILKQMQTEIKSIYSLIFKDLDDLFYSVI